MAPTRHPRGVTSRPAAVDHQDFVRGPHDGHLEVVAVVVQPARPQIAGHVVAIHAAEACLGIGFARVFIEVVLNIPLGPAVFGDVASVLGAHDDQHFPAAIHIGAADIGHAVRKGAHGTERGVVKKIAHAVRCSRRENGYRAVLRFKAALHVQRLPRAIYLILGDTVSKFAGVSQGRLIRSARQSAAQVVQNQPGGASNRRVGPPPLAK